MSTHSGLHKPGEHTGSTTGIWRTGSYASHIRVALLGILLAALMLQAGTVYWLYRIQVNIEQEMYQPLLDALDQMQAERVSAVVPGRRVLRERSGRQLNQRFNLQDTVYSPVARAWNRIPPSARTRMNKGETVRIERHSEYLYEVAFARLHSTGGSTQVWMVERPLPGYGAFLQIRRWSSVAYVAGLSLLLVAVFLVTRELTKPFRELQRVAAVAKDRLGWTTVPSEDQWSEVIDTFTATIDELRAKETRLKERFHSSEEERIRLDRLNSQIVDAVPSALLAVDRDGAIAQFNLSSRALPGLGVPCHGASVVQHFKAWAPMARVLRQQAGTAPVSVEGEFDIRARGERHHFYYQITPVADGGVLLLLADRTRLRHLEAVLAQKARLAALGETAAGLAHELRNALGAIIGYARLMSRAPGTEISDVVGRIEAEASEMEEMLNRFLEVARPAEMQPSPLVGEDLLDEILERFQGRFDDAGVHLVRSYAPRGKVSVDSFWFRQALNNLLDNALHMVPEGGMVTVATLRTRNSWSVTVADSGPGIPPEWREKVMSPFVSLRPGGTGLGLALVQKVMTAHDGQVEISESLEGGASLCLVFSTKHAGMSADTRTTLK